MQVDANRTRHEDALRRLGEARLACKELLHQFRYDDRLDPEVRA